MPSMSYSLPKLSKPAYGNTSALLRFLILATISAAAVASRLFAVIRHESIIHELCVRLRGVGLPEIELTTISPLAALQRPLVQLVRLRSEPGSAQATRPRAGPALASPLVRCLELSRAQPYLPLQPREQSPRQRGLLCACSQRLVVATAGGQKLTAVHHSSICFLPTPCAAWLSLSSPPPGVLELVRPDSLVSSRSCRRRHRLPGLDGDGWRHLECAPARQPRGRHPQRLRYDGARLFGPDRLEHIPVRPHHPEEYRDCAAVTGSADSSPLSRHADSRTSSSPRASTRPVCWPLPSSVLRLVRSKAYALGGLDAAC